jgi:thiamine biosynthesis lipoprotein
VTTTLHAPEHADDLVRRAEPVMGTVVSIHVRPGHMGPGPRPLDEVYLAIAEARARLHRADAVFSTWKEHSPLSRIRRGELRVERAPPEVAEVLARAAEAKKRSGGWFDPWAAPGGVDPTGLVKGWAAARALAALRDCGAAAAMVNAGGDVAVWGPRQPDHTGPDHTGPDHTGQGHPWRIGIQNPFDRASLAAVVEVGSAVATSGCYERGRHVFDPFTGRPASAVASATVTGPELDMADALATGLLAGGWRALEHVEALEGYEALLIAHDGSLHPTAGLALL